MKKVSLLISVLLISITALQAQKTVTFKYGANPEDSIKCIENLNGFRTYYTQKDYQKAYEYWQDLVNACPRSWSALFSYSQNMFDNLIKDEEDSVRKERLIDSLLWSYQVRHIHFPENFSEGSGFGFQGYNLMRYRRRTDYAKAYDLFVKSIDMEKEKSQPTILDYYMRTAEIMLKMNKDTTYIIEAYERASEPIDLAIENAYKQYEKQLAELAVLDSLREANRISAVDYEKKFKLASEDTARQMKLVDNYQKTMTNIELIFMPYAPCSVLEKVYAVKLAENKSNITVVGKIVRTMSKAGCVDSPVFMEGLSLYHEQNPAAFSAFLLGNSSLKAKEYDKAIGYYQQAISLYETNESKVMAYFLMASCYQLKNEYSRARSAAQEALRINPNFGRAYILIGQLYAYSASQCNTDGALPYATSWAAADKFHRAMAVDSSVASDARAALAGLTYPSEGDKNMRALKAGDSYRVGCWIQENTTVR
ncbi:MAG: tetratricopeptide repeat protein [Bacteroidales bacterium]|jgi:tetratricopeptide (TPR) repeat protein|nr:tetratricopeptide repeat protein [Bacteroidales bacterium]